MTKARDLSKSTLPSQSGNSGKYLTTDGTAQSWGTVAAGSMTQIAQTVISTTGTTNFTWSSIPTTYKMLKISYYNGWNTYGKFCHIEFNGDTTAANYKWAGAEAGPSANTQSLTTTQANGWYGDGINVGGFAVFWLDSSAYGTGTVEIYQPSSTGTKSYLSNYIGRPDFAATGSAGGIYTGTSAITQIKIRPDVGDIQGTFTLWGVN